MRWAIGLMLLCVPALAAAQGLGFTQRTDEPITIEADEGVEWRQNEQVYIARGNATASQAGRTIRADRLIAHYRPDDQGENRIWKIVAEAGVVITTDEDRITGSHGVYLVEDATFTLDGSPVTLESDGRTVTGDQLIYDSRERVATVEGNARAVEGERRVNAERFIAHMGEDEGGESRIERVEATGGVVIVRPGEVARGDRGTYDMRSEIATLEGNVRLTRGENQLNGERAEVNFRTGVSRLLAGESGRVRGFFTPREGEEGRRQNELPTGGDRDENTTPNR